MVLLAVAALSGGHPLQGNIIHVIMCWWPPLWAATASNTQNAKKTPVSA